MNNGALKISSAEWLGAAAQPAQWPRDGLPQIAFCGRSNSGKSSLLNALTRRKKLARVSKTPGCTRLIHFFRINAAPNANAAFYFVDLPGYGYAKVSKAEKAAWGRMIETYLRSCKQLAGLIQVLDARRAPNDDDLLLLEWCRHGGVPAILALSKIDKISRNAYHKQRTEIINAICSRLEGAEFPAVGFSAQNGRGRDQLLEQLSILLQGGASR